MLQLVVSHKPPNGLGAVAVATSAKESTGDVLGAIPGNQ